MIAFELSNFILGKLWEGPGPGLLGDKIETSLNTMTIEWCLYFCIDFCLYFCIDYDYTGVQFGAECYCGNMLTRLTILSDGDCNMKCAGD